MTKYREIIRLTGLGFTQRNIMQSCDVAQKTVVKIQHRAKELNLSWSLDESMTDDVLEKLLFVTLFDTPIVSLNDTVILSNRHSSQNH